MLRRARGAGHRSIRQHALMLGLQVLSTKTLRQVGLSFEVGFVRRPTTKNHCWDPTVVVVEVHRYQSLQSSERIEPMQV